MKKLMREQILVAMQKLLRRQKKVKLLLLGIGVAKNNLRDLHPF
jgi:hypothetical protein